MSASAPKGELPPRLILDLACYEGVLRAVLVSPLLGPFFRQHRHVINGSVAFNAILVVKLFEVNELV